MEISPACPHSHRLCDPSSVSLRLPPSPAGGEGRGPHTHQHIPRIRLRFQRPGLFRGLIPTAPENRETLVPVFDIAITRPGRIDSMDYLDSNFRSLDAFPGASNASDGVFSSDGTQWTIWTPISGSGSAVEPDSTDDPDSVLGVRRAGQVPCFRKGATWNRRRSSPRGSSTDRVSTSKIIVGRRARS